MTKLIYDHTNVGYTCRACGFNYLHRRPWRWRYCPVCWQERTRKLTRFAVGLAIGISIGTVLIRLLSLELHIILIAVLMSLAAGIGFMRLMR